MLRYLLLMQFMISVLCALIAGLICGIQGIISAILGGLVAIIPGVFFAKMLFKYKGAMVAKKIIKSVYVGEALKIFMTIVLFTLIFALCKILPLVFLLTYILVVLSHWFAPLLIITKRYM